METLEKIETYLLAKLIKLLPCPWCGNSREFLIEKDRLDLTYAVRCLVCEAKGPIVKRNPILAWNHRR